MAIIFLYTTDENSHGFMEVVSGHFDGELPLMRMKALMLDIEFKREDIDNLSLSGEELYICKTHEMMVLRAHISDRKWRKIHGMEWIQIVIPFKRESIQATHRKGELQYIMYDEPFEKAQCELEITSIEGMFDIAESNRPIILDE